jgi:hypothetical protein
VTIFTDGRPGDVAPLLALKNAQLADDNPDIVDLLLLSRSKCIIAAAGSTFSYWAGFLADAPVVLHPSHAIVIRPATVNRYIFEGPLPDEACAAKLLADNLGSIPADERC